MKQQHCNSLARCLHDFFSNYLPGLRGMSPHTIQSYRDALILLLRFISVHNSLKPAKLDLEDIGHEEVVLFLNYLEKDRHNTTSTRNVRLAAIHTFFYYISSHYPDRLKQAQCILGIPFKRTSSKAVDYLEYDQIEAIFNSVDRSTPKGRRDYTLLVTMFNTGARAQEILDLRVHDLQLIRPFQLRLYGKGRKERICPLWPRTVQVLRDFLEEHGLDLQSDVHLFLNHRGEVMTRFGVRYILTKQIEKAKATVPTLSKKKLHPHSMRHSTAIHLLKSGVDLFTISQWLGHTSVNTTNKYAHIDLEMKRQALAKAELEGDHPRLPKEWRQNTNIIEWLESL